jgi:hypothetical protein
MESAPNAMSAMKNYFAHPIANIGVDIAGHMVGVPPVMAAKSALPVMGAVYDKYKQAMNNLGGLNPAAEKVIQNSEPFLQNIVTPGELRDIKTQLVPGKNLNNFELPKRLAGMPEAEAFKAAIKSGAPGIGEKILGTVAPVARTAARVAGPAGMAYNLYQGGEMARQTKLGQRLSEGQGQIAPQSAQNMQLNTNTSGYQPTAQEAANLLQSGDQRTQAIYGGVQRLQQLKQQQDAQATAVLSQPPTAQNFMARMQALAHKYGTAMPNL